MTNSQYQIPKILLTLVTRVKITNRIEVVSIDVNTGSEIIEQSMLRICIPPLTSIVFPKTATLDNQL